MWPAPNTSNGFHEEMKELWEMLAPNPGHVLLAGEGGEVGDHFRSAYPHWTIDTVNMDAALRPNICADMCRAGWIEKGKYGLIIDQANLEHVYDPFGMCRVLTSGLAPKGVYVLYTVAQGVPYHGYPRDYFRFMIDWFYDLPRWLGNTVELAGFSLKNDVDIFAAYRKREA